ncbi:toxin-antitoxin system YwqK family antitoxin [Lewinella cohaerens]|uniref:toxin-antitoxin system YwqK family antitoxin n=1 Tax=Lewinella cohaerens TaxID=70995 RepID=UPI000362E318|nr:hypothetical protein [Lewinella cohaerens]
MKYIIFALFSLGVFFTSCTEKRDVKRSDTLVFTKALLEIPNIIIDNSELHYDNNKSLWSLNDQLYSGYAVSYYQDGNLKEKIGILGGKKQNQAIQWYPDGHYKQTANYHKGRLDGEKKVWSSEPAHVLIAQLNYNAGKAHGEQKKWYPTGELFKKLNLNMGREEGIQQAFRKNGALFANYEAKEGRIFGLKKAALCFGLENENIQYEK